MTGVAPEASLHRHPHRLGSVYFEYAIEAVVNGEQPSTRTGATAWPTAPWS